MNVIEKALGKIAGGSVLDVATQEGHFVRALMKHLQSYRQVVGIDVNEQAIKIAQDTIRQEKVRFLVMNAEQLEFGDESFDTVSISASFHHLADIQRVLAEMKRVLKPKGNFIVAEMHRDGQTEAELTSVYLHHWVAEVDTALGCLHRPTLTRRALLEHVQSLGLSQGELYDDADRDSDPMEESRIAQLDELIQRVTQRAETADASGELKRRGEELRRRLHKVGAQKEPVLWFLGKK